MESKMTDGSRSVKELSEILGIGRANMFKFLYIRNIPHFTIKIKSYKMSFVTASNFEKAVLSRQEFEKQIIASKTKFRDSWGNVVGPLYKKRTTKIDKIEGEIWKNVVGYEGIYEISSLGRLKSVRRTVRHNNVITGIQTVGGTLFALQNHKLGYKIVGLKKDGKYKNRKVHSLVAEAFIPNPNKKRTVNHINGIRNDNRVENLEWATHSENNLDRFKRLNEKISLYKSAYDMTIGKGINPDAVEIMYKTLNALSTELDNYFASITHEDVASMGFRREIKELHSFAKAAINKAKTI